MSFGSRVYDNEQELKIIYGLINFPENLLGESDYSGLSNEINDFFKLKYYLSECHDGQSISRLHDELMRKLSQINTLKKQKLNEEQLNFISSCTTERYENSNLQRIKTNTGYIVTPDPELINNPKFADIT